MIGEKWDYKNWDTGESRLDSRYIVNDQQEAPTAECVRRRPLLSALRRQRLGYFYGHNIILL